MCIIRKSRSPWVDQAVTVIPVLVDDASMPRTEQLPQDLQKLSDQQAYKIGDTQARRKADLDVLIENYSRRRGLQPRAETIIRQRMSARGERALVVQAGFHGTWMGSFSSTVCSAMIAYRFRTGSTAARFSSYCLCSMVSALGGKRLWRMWANRRRRAAEQSVTSGAYRGRILVACSRVWFPDRARPGDSSHDPKHVGSVICLTERPVIVEGANTSLQAWAITPDGKPDYPTDYV